jgi:hypothetical protein
MAQGELEKAQNKSRKTPRPPGPHGRVTTQFVEYHPKAHGLKDTVQPLNRDSVVGVKEV